MSPINTPRREEESRDSKIYKKFTHRDTIGSGI
jgi:hypothetical protein